MKYYVTADTHLGHDKVLEFEKDRKGFNSCLKWLKMIKKDDVLIHLGDVVFGDINYWFDMYRSLCRGKLVIVRGNHDKSYSWFYDRGADFVSESFELYRFGELIKFTHRPIIANTFINIHGHMHRQLSHHDYSFYNKNNILVTTENDCAPVSLEKLIRRRINE